MVYLIQNGCPRAWLVNPTDGLDYMQTPGYFGHIDLADHFTYNLIYNENFTMYLLNV